jgi:hypothetical protein
MHQFISEFRPSGSLDWLSILLLAMSAAFLVVGLSRIVEFEGLGLGKIVKPILIVTHIFGCFLFAAAMALFAIDVHKAHTQTIAWLLAPALIILLPVHIYLGLKRRIKIRDLTKS